ncbi:MAG: recombinase family protein [Planctomycetes bacterium]|nr:recombinase family protein [Planctomycetota bacterium]
MKKVALYARVSSRIQAERDTIENQLVELRQFASQNVCEISDVYCDNGVSGVLDDRPELNRLIKDAESKRFDAVVVVRLDRLGRSLRNLIDTIELFKELCIDFVSLKERFDTSTDAGKLLFHIVGAMAEFERNMISSRVRSGMRRRKAEGKSVFGIRNLKVKPENIGEVYNLRAKRCSLRAIGKELGISRTRVSQLLKERNKIELLLNLGKTARDISIALGVQERRVQAIISHINMCQETTSKLTLSLS